MKAIFYILLVALSVLKATQFKAQPTSWQSSEIGSGGAVYAPVANPLNPAEVYLSCDMGVMFHSTDSARNWSTIPFTTLIGNRFSEVQFTNDNNVRYVLRQPNGLSTYQAAISTDAGQSWNNITPNSMGQFGAFKLFAHPQMSNVIVVSGIDKIYFSNTSGQSYSTIYNPGSTIHLAGVFFDNNNIYVATNKGLMIVDINGNLTMAFTTHASMGFINASEDLVSFSGAHQGTKIRFVGVSLMSANFSPKTYAVDVSNFSQIYKMDYDLGMTWNAMTTNLKSGAPNNRVYNIAMKPDDTQTFYLGGQARVPDNATGITLGTVFKTTDGGSTFSNIFLNAGYTTNSNMSTGWQGTNNGGSNWKGNPWNGINTTESISVSRTDINYVLRSDKSNVYISTDGGVTWQQRYVQSAYEHAPGTIIHQADNYHDNGLQSTVSYWVTWLDQQNMYGSYADLLAERSTDGGNTWSFDYTGLDTVRVNDASMMVRHPDGTLYAATGDVPGSNGDYSDLRTSLANRGRVSFSTDNGASWQTFYSFTRSVLSICFNPANTQEMYVTVGSETGGIGGIYKFTDKNDPNSKIPIPAPAGTVNRPGHINVLADGSLVIYYTATDIGASAPVYTYSATSGVFYSTDDGQNWLSNNLPGMQYDLRSLTIDPWDPTQKTWYACVGGNGTGSVPGIYKTVDYGQNWSLLITGVKAITCTFHPARLGEMYVCSEDAGLFYYTGIYGTPNGQLVSSYPFKRPQQVFFNPYDPGDVWVTSFGNGIKHGYDPSPPTISKLSDNQLCASDTLRITGTGFTTATSVSVFGNNLNYTVLADTLMEVYFTGAISGGVSITNANGTFNGIEIINVSALPDASVTPSGNLQLCAGLSIDLVAVSGYTYLWNDGSSNQTLTVNASGSYQLEVQDHNGCKAVSAPVVVNVNPMPNVQLVSDASSITAVQTNANYQWIDCSNNLPISGQVSASFSPSNDGSYAVIIDLNGCTDTSSCLSFVISGAGLVEASRATFSLFPNPAHHDVSVCSMDPLSDEIRIFDLNGQLMLSAKPNMQNHLLIDVSMLASGVYFIEVSGNRQRLVIE